MKKKNKILFAFLILYLVAFNLYAFGTKEIEKILESHPDFVSIESWILRENLFVDYSYDIDVKLKDGKSITFTCVDKHGGGKYCCVGKIGEFSVDSRILIKNRQAASAGINFIDLSNILDTEIKSIKDAIDNYQAILDFVSVLARDQYCSGVNESKKLNSYSYFNDLDFIKNFHNHFYITEARKTVMFVMTVSGFPLWVWDGIQEDEVKYCGIFNDRFGEGWEHKNPENIVRKSLGLE